MKKQILPNVAALPFLSAVILAACASCASGPAPERPSAVHKAAIEKNRDGAMLLERRKYDAAMNSFRAALRLSRSIDDRDGMANALLNMTRTCRATPKCAETPSLLAEAESVVSPGTPLYRETLFERARLALSSGEYALGLATANRLLDASADDKAMRGRAMNLKALLLFASGDTALARTSANAALLLNRETEIRSEEANSLRILGDIERSARNWSAAAAHCNAALEADRKLGASRYVALDLVCLGECAAATGDSKAAADFSKRAADAAEAAGITFNSP
ncbi:MAG: hypothetical protein HZA20_04785 [Nitrospirae bacterium]|nr:hypothetical protein [Nitrospirota bacterium]